MKKIIISILLLISLCISLFGCRNIIKNTEFSDSDTSEFASATEAIDPMSYACAMCRYNAYKRRWSALGENPKDYKLENHNGKVYMVFDSQLLFEAYKAQKHTCALQNNDNGNLYAELSGIWLESVEELYTKIAQGQLTISEKHHLISCYIDFGIVVDDVGLEIFDLNKMYSPNHPSIQSPNLFMWEGTVYSAELTVSTEGSLPFRYCNFFVGTDSYWENYCSRRYGELKLDKTQSAVINGQEIDIYYTADERGIYNSWYTVQDGSRTVTIYNSYIDTFSSESIPKSFNESMKITDITPREITAVFNDNDGKYAFRFPLYSSITIEQILELSAEKYFPPSK